MNVLVDTSVWADHFRRPEPQLVALLDEGRVLIHAFVLGELALGNLRDRSSTLSALHWLTPAGRATDDEVLAFVDSAQLSGRGIGLIDVHLLAAARLTSESRLWTRDKRLAAAADELDLLYAE